MIRLIKCEDTYLTREVFSAIILRGKSSNSIEDIMNPSFAQQPNKSSLSEVVGSWSQYYKISKIILIQTKLYKKIMGITSHSI